MPCASSKAMHCAPESGSVLRCHSGGMEQPYHAATDMSHLNGSLCSSVKLEEDSWGRGGVRIEGRVARGHEGEDKSSVGFCVMCPHTGSCPGLTAGAERHGKGHQRRPPARFLTGRCAEARITS